MSSSRIPRQEPAFAAGGFLRDQVAQYNDFAIRQALLSLRETRDGSRAARSRSEGRTLLRTVWADDGTRVLSDRPSPYGLAIRSPYAEGSWRDVRTTDWRSSPGLLGHDGDVSLPADLKAGLFQARLNGRDCDVSRETPQYFMYCQSALASDASLVDPLRIRSASERDGREASAARDRIGSAACG